MTTRQRDGLGEDLYDNGLRIARIGDARSDWSICCAVPPIGLWKRDLAKRFTTLTAARAAVVHMEVVRLRRIKQARHLVLTAVFSASAVWSYQIMALPEQWYRVEWFAVATIAVVVALSECLSAFLMVIDDGWDYRYEVPRITVVDRLIARMFLTYPSRRPHGVAAERSRVWAVDVENTFDGTWPG